MRNLLVRHQKKLWLVVLLVLIYLPTWFVAANKIKNHANKFLHEFSEHKSGLVIKKQKVKVTGFPFCFQLRFDDINFISDPSSSFNYHISADSIKIKTNILLNSFSFVMPEHFSVRFALKDSNYFYNFVSTDKHSFSIKSENFYNLDQVFYKKAKIFDIFFKNFSSIFYQANKLNATSNNNDYSSNSNVQVIIKNMESSKEVNRYIFKNKLDYQSLNSLFSFIKNDFVIRVDLKNRENGISDIKQINIDKFDLTLDKTKFIIYGDAFLKVNDNKTIDIKIKIINLEILLNLMLTNKYLNSEQISLIKILLKEVTAKELADEINFVISRNNNGLIRFGLADFNSIKNAIEQLKLGQ